MQFHCRHSIVTDPVKGQPFSPRKSNAAEPPTVPVHRAEAERRTTAAPVRHTARPAAAAFPDLLRPIRLPTAPPAIVAAAISRTSPVQTKVSKADRADGHALPVPIRDANRPFLPLPI